MRAESESWSAKAPSPEPNTSPILGLIRACESRNCAAALARENRSSFGMQTSFQPQRTQRNTEEFRFQTVCLIFLLKLGERPFQFPLHACALAAVEELLARGGIFLSIGTVGGTCRNRVKISAQPPQALAGQETVFQALPRHTFQVGIRKVVGLLRS